MNNTGEVMKHKNEIGVANYPADKEKGVNLSPNIRNDREKSKVYLVYDLPDQLLVKDIKDSLAKDDYIILEPDFQGTLIDRRNNHENNLLITDVILIFYGRENMLWLRTKLLDVLKSPGLGRNKPLPERIIYATNHVKIIEEFLLKYQAKLIRQTDDFSFKKLSEFLNKVAKSHAAVSE